MYHQESNRLKRLLLCIKATVIRRIYIIISIISKVILLSLSTATSDSLLEL